MAETAWCGFRAVLVQRWEMESAPGLEAAAIALCGFRAVLVLSWRRPTAAPNSCMASPLITGRPWHAFITDKLIPPSTPPCGGSLARSVSMLGNPSKPASAYNGLLVASASPPGRALLSHTGAPLCPAGARP